LIEWRQRAKARLQQSWYGRDPTLVAVPLTLAAIELLAQQAQLRFLLFPPLAALAYLLFTRPVGPHATWRGAVVAPSVGAGIGTVGTLAFQPGFLGVLVIAFLTMLMMRLLGVTTPPVLAVALLPLVFGTEGLDYPVSILLGTALLFVLFQVEQHLLSTADRSGNA
jgi:CBS-domain-containing membrane protein